MRHMAQCDWPVRGIARTVPLAAGSFHSGIVWRLGQLSYLSMRRVVVDVFLSTRSVPVIGLASPQDQETLKQLAQTDTGLTGYIVEVTGFADSTGSAAMNTKLSEDRAKAVITFLMQQGNVPIRHIVAPGAMGEYGPKASNETKAGRAENRRFEVKVLVNKGIAR